MLYKLSQFVAGPFLKLLFRLEVEGLENIPEGGPAILASNHTSSLDHYLFPAVVKRRITFIAKAELFENKILGFMLKRWGQIPIERGTGDKGAIDQALGVLERGEVFGIYPEGTRTRDGKLHEGHTGVARIAVRSGAPVIPVGMIGTYEILPRGKIWPNFRKARIRVGEPMDFSDRDPDDTEWEEYRRLTSEIMEAIGELAGQKVEGELYRYDEILPQDWKKREGVRGDTHARRHL